MSNKVMPTLDHVAPEDRKLNRGIHSWHVTFIALGGIVGSGYFLASGAVVAEVGPSAAFAYILGGIIIYAVMMAFGELLVNLPRRGSFVSYAKEFMGPSAATGIGWSYWSNWVAYCPAEALALGILMDTFVPWSPSLYALFFMGIITLINVYQVTWFGHIESILAIIKISAIVLFSILALGIIFGVIGGTFVGTSVLVPAGTTSIYDALFPAGGVAVIITMTLILVNFQGSEIVGLAAAETQNPEINVPRACKAVTYRIIGIYVIPLLLLVSILPYSEAGLESVVFSTALAKYGMGWAAGFFTIVVMIAAFSCANSGVYGTVRALYGLAVEGLAPKQFMRLNRFNVPMFATIFTIVPMWLVLLPGALGELGIFNIPSFADSGIYLSLLYMSGFTGTICWLGIIISAMLMRKKLTARGYDVKATLKNKMPMYPALPIVGIVLMLVALIGLGFQPDYFTVLFFAIPAVLVPAAIYKLASMAKKVRIVTTDSDEIAFDLKYPPLNK
jgi:AAT family amino acid transporter